MRLRARRFLPPGNGDDDRGDDLPRRSVLQFLPKKNLRRAAMLLVLLLGLVAIQRRSGSVLDALNRIFLPITASPPSGR